MGRIEEVICTLIEDGGTSAENLKTLVDVLNVRGLISDENRHYLYANIEENAE